MTPYRELDSEANCCDAANPKEYALRESASEISLTLNEIIGVLANILGVHSEEVTQENKAEDGTIEQLKLILGVIEGKARQIRAYVRVIERKI